MRNSFEKAKWNVDDEKVYQGITYFVSGFSAKGSPLWKKKKDQGQQKNTAGVSSNKSSVTTTNSITTSTSPVDTTDTLTPKNSQKADFQVSKTADGKRFSFNYSGKEYQFDSKKKATELSALLSKTNNGRGIQKVFEYLSENFPNPISGMADNQLIHLGYIPSGDFHGNSQDQRSHRYDPINVANRVCESVMVGKKQVSDFLPEIIYLRNMDHGVKSLYDRYRQWVPTELMENKKHYEKIANNSMETATRKQSARQHLQAISLITDAYDKFFAQWNN